MQNAYGRAILGILTTSLTSQWWSTLPSVSLVLGIIFLIFVLIVINKKMTGYPFSVNRFFWQNTITISSPYLIGALIGIVWFASLGHWYALWQLSEDKIQQDVTIHGDIVSIHQSSTSDRYILSLTSLGSKTYRGRVRVNWFRPTKQFAPGQTVSLCVRLKPAHGLQNPAGFDYWRWLVSKRINATGYVKQCEQNKLLIPDNSFAASIKYRLSAMSLSGEKWLKALMFADRSDFTKSDWQTLQASGLAHLFALSGLHMGIILVFSFWLSRITVFVSTIWFRSDRPLNLLKSTLILSNLLALMFVWLCDFPITLFRAWLAVSVVLMTFVFSGVMRPGQMVSLCAVACVLTFPFSIYGMSLYLSFAAVLIILLLIWRIGLPSKGVGSKTYYAIKLQVLLGAIMTLVSAVSFGKIYWMTILLNLIAVPIITLLVVPLCLFGVLLLIVFPSLAQLILQPVGILLETAMSILQDAPLPGVEMNLSWQQYLVICIIVCCLLMPPHRLRWPLITAFCLNLFLAKPQNHIEEETWQVEIFDVGQGSSMLISAQDKGLLIDTGASYPSGFSMAESVLEPHLKSSGLTLPLEGLVTHFDNDHAGGMKYLKDAGIVNNWRWPGNGCNTGEIWTLGHLRIEAIWPEQGNQVMSENNASCVLLITDGTIRLLVPGDIEATAEKALLQIAAENLEADLVIAPHHGSKTSSTEHFVNAVSPQYVIFTAGFRNRWRFPNQQVVARYEAVNSRILNTAKSGYIRFELNSLAGKKHIEMATWRDDLSPRWYKSLVVE